ncbi:hypothetical protein AVEN_242413-1 [Araneus ventricosus]|uniref:Integrase catalytic domain-containing protein n=1 Tax=Araneus ventricosus TaxID=182803 RepID=A0A4Y2VPI8_ARAVE|nr:hypothetical protein AVEN_242413-1 [Araneus ventricosus]
MNNQDHATKFCLLRPLETKRAAEVALELMKVFLNFGDPYIFQSDNCREFTANVINELSAMWPDCKIVHGKPRHPQSQGSVAVMILKIYYVFEWTTMERQIG